jgi:hypothetical protein
MIILGGSPLGLVGVTTDSKKTSNPKIQYSTFNAGKTRNINVYQYNTSEAGTQTSLFTGRRRLRPWPNIKLRNDAAEGKYYDTHGFTEIDSSPDQRKLFYQTQGKKGDEYSRKDLHNNDVYDTSITHIIERLANTKAALRPADFAYCKDLGVYPNNRLMIARRFLGAIDDNIMVNSSGQFGSVATIISWLPENEDIFSINFGEVWTEADASFSGIIDGIGNDFKKKGLGEIMGGGAGAIPLPGFTEILQRQLMEKMGIITEGSANTIPSGNPNLIKEAKVRRTVGYDEPGSGLMGKLSFKFTAEYELKFISGIDPTIVWMDLIANFLRFGTSESIKWGLSGSFAAKMKKWLNNPNALVVELGKQISKAVQSAITAISRAAEQAMAAFESEQLSSNELAGDGSDGEDDETKEAFIRSAKNAYRKIVNTVIRGLKSVLSGVVQKYKVKAIGVFNALTGAPSTPWHVTIGNPLRPIFCSGDMYTQDVQVTFGPQLAFNDLPSSIKVEFTLTNARNLGLQEIMGKFNSGYLRTVDIQKSFYETNTYQVGSASYYETPGLFEYENQLGDAIKDGGVAALDGGSTVVNNSSSSSNELALEPEPKPKVDNMQRTKDNDWYGFDQADIPWDEKGGLARKTLQVGDKKYNSKKELTDAQNKKKNENVEKNSDKKADPKTIDKGKKNNKKNSK